MTAWTARTASPFGRALTAVVTPMHDDGSLDLAGLQKVVAHLLRHGHDGVVVSGTTGESATTSDEEQDQILRAALEAVGDRGRVVAGVGTNDTAHTVHLAKQAAATGAHALLVVTPYYNRPTQPGLLAHFTAVADATGLPVMLYDIPARTGTPIATETLLRLADHPHIAAVKDAKGDLWSATKVLDQTDLLWFSGDDIATLAHLTQGATGYVGVATHVAGAEYAAMLAAVDAGDLPPPRPPPPAHPGRRRDHEHQPGCDHGQGRAQGARRHRLGGRPATAGRVPPEHLDAARRLAR